MVRYRSVSFSTGLCPYEPDNRTGSRHQEDVITRDMNTKPKPRRLAALVAVLALAGALGGCVIYPAGGYYGGGYYHYHHWGHDRWR